MVAEASAPIVNVLGLHARPAAEFVKTAARFTAAITVRKESLEVNGKSIMGMMMLAAECGSAILIRADGAGRVAVPDAPGLGIDLIADGIEKFRVA